MYVESPDFILSLSKESSSLKQLFCAYVLLIVLSHEVNEGWAIIELARGWGSDSNCSKAGGRESGVHLIDYCNKLERGFFYNYRYDQIYFIIYV